MTPFLSMYLAAKYPKLYKIELTCIGVHVLAFGLFLAQTKTLWLSIFFLHIPIITQLHPHVKNFIHESFPNLILV